MGYPTLTHAAALNPRQSVRYPLQNGAGARLPGLPAPASPQCGQQRMRHALGGAPTTAAPRPTRRPARALPRTNAHCLRGGERTATHWPGQGMRCHPGEAATLTPAGAGHAVTREAARLAGRLGEANGLLRLLHQLRREVVGKLGQRAQRPLARRERLHAEACAQRQKRL